MPNGLLSLLWGAMEALILGLPYASGAAKSKERGAAQAQLTALKITDQATSIVFDGAVAQALRTEESFRTSNGRVIDYVLTVFAVTPANRYFLFKSNATGRPYLKELASERARLVLKEDFRAYTQGDA